MNNANKTNRNKIVGMEIQQASGNVRTLVNNKINVIEKIRLRVSKAIKTDQQIPIFNNIIPIISSKEVLLLAYDNIKSNYGSMTPGSQNQTADSISMDRINLLSEKLKNSTYEFPDVRRTWLPKPGKNYDWKNKDNLIQYGRPLGMPDFDAKIVQETARIILNAIYEPIFEKTNVSYGFRPNKGCQNVMFQITPKTQGMDLAIEGDIKGAFNNLDHNILMKILNRRINDKKFLSLIYDMCKAGIFDQLQNIRTDSLLGVPQGAITSPILWNIYMHEFDNYILTEIHSFVQILNIKQNRSSTSCGSKIYKNYIYKMNNSKKKYNALTKNQKKSLKELSDTDKRLAIEYLKQYKKDKMESIKVPSKNFSKIPLRFTYLRYADDWILFSNCKPVVARYIKNKISSYLKYYLGLTLSLEKTKITNLYTDEAKFLGFAVRKQKQKLAITKTGVLKRVAGQKVYIGVDKQRLLSRMEWRGFHKNLRPREKPAWSIQSDFEIIGKYNSIIQGLVNYYAPIISYRSTLNHYIYILEYSCYKTLCQKHRTTIRKLSKKYGFPLKVKFLNSKDNEKIITLLTCKTYWKELKDTVEKLQTNLAQGSTDQSVLASSDFLNNAKSYLRTSFKMKGRCVICGCKDNIEIHHIKHVRKSDTDKKKGFSRIMSLLNRKQIPVCKFHHNAIHKGEYDNIALSDLYDSRIANPENYLKLY